jgi:hypothetical protein
MTLSPWLTRAMCSTILLLGIGCGDKTHIVGSTADGSADSSGGGLGGPTSPGGAGGTGATGAGGTMTKDAPVETGGNGGTGGAIASGGIGGTGGLTTGGAGTGGVGTGGAKTGGTGMGGTGTGGTGMGGAGTGGVGTGGAMRTGGISGTGGATRDAAADGNADSTPALDAQAMAALCTRTGGQVVTASCCNSSWDFKDTCLYPTCACAPEYSHDVSMCLCPSRECFSNDIGCTAAGTGGAGGAGGARGTGGAPGSGGMTGAGGGGTGGGTSADTAEYTACEYLGDTTQERIYRIDRAGSVCTEITFSKGLGGCALGLTSGEWCLAGSALSADISNCANGRVLTGTIKTAVGATGNFSVNTGASPPVVDFDLTLQYPASPGLPQSVHAWGSGCKANCTSTDCRE